jgi:hypothetical protein
MGTNISKQSTESITDITNQTMNNISTSINTGSSSYLRTNQRLYINQGMVDTGGGDYNVSQSSNIVLSTIINNTTSLSNDLSTSLMSQIRKELDTQIKQVNEDLNLGQTNIAIQDTLSNTDIKNIISTSVDTTVSSTVTSDSQNEQELHIRNLGIKTRGGDVNISQSSIIEALAKNISSNIVENVISSVVSNEVSEKITMKADQLNKGIDIFAMFAVFVIIAVIGLGGFAYLRTGGIARAAERSVDKSGDIVVSKISDLDLSSKSKSYYGGASNKKLIAKLTMVCAALLSAGYFGVYAPKKQEIKDKYDLSYLSKNKL